MVALHTYTTANSRPSWDIHNPHSRLGQIFVSYARKVYNPIGFKKGYNFPLFLIGVGGLMGFVLSRMMYFDIDGTFSNSTIPGEWYYYRAGHGRVGIIMHLVGVLPGGFLACFQFVPIIRYKVILFHRINGYLASLLLLVGIVGALMIARHSIGGDMSLQMWTGTIGSLLIIFMGLAIYNIKRLQIDLHRAFMLRLWTVSASIATLRLLMMAAEHVSVTYGYVWHTSIRCAEIYFRYAHVGVPDRGNPTARIYPQCAMERGPGGIPTGANADPATNTKAFVSVGSDGTGPENSAAMLRTTFVMAAWLALILHVLAIETYLWLTPAESYRLRCVSYERQVEKGIRQRGSFKDAGLTSTRMGNAPDWWGLPLEDYMEQRALMRGADEADKVPAAGKSGSETDIEESAALPERSS